MSSENAVVPMIWQTALAAAGLCAVVVQIFVARRRAPTESVPAWNARAPNVLGFLGFCVFCLLAASLLCSAVAQTLFPNFDFSANPQMLVPPIQTFALGALLAAIRFFPEAFPQKFNAPREKRSRDWLSPKNPFGVPALFLSGFFATVAAALFIKTAVGFLPENVRAIFAEKQELVDALMRSDPLVIAFCVPAIAVFTPIIEEIIFRAGLYRLLKSKLPAVPAALASSVIFALLHDAPVAYLPLTLLGCVLCLAYEKTGRIAAPILVHALFNANTLLCLALAQ